LLYSKKYAQCLQKCKDDHLLLIHRLPPDITDGQGLEKTILWMIKWVQVLRIWIGVLGSRIRNRIKVKAKSRGVS
jgi:hypothetical protein